MDILDGSNSSFCADPCSIFSQEKRLAPLFSNVFSDVDWVYASTNSAAAIEVAIARSSW